MTTNVDTLALEAKVKSMYERVARDPRSEFHFEMGRALAERLGYRAVDLDRIPEEAIESFAGVGYHLRLAGLQRGESVLDLGSGSGMDSFLAAHQVGERGFVAGVDMTEAQRTKAERLRQIWAFDNVRFYDAYIDALPFEDASFDCVISNGVINLAADKRKVFREAARVLRRGGRIALSDIVTSKQLPDQITCNADLWAACIGGAMQRESIQDAAEEAGLRVFFVQPNPQYKFLSDSANGAAKSFDVKSISFVAIKY